jgi:hypothetical protein
MSARDEATRVPVGRYTPSLNASLDPTGELLDRIQIDFGPIDLLGRFFLQAESAARERGVILSFAKMEDLVCINRENRDSWRPLLPHYDPSYGGITARNAFCIVGRNYTGDIVATQAARLYEWNNTTLFDEATSLRLFYPEPERMRRPGEACLVTARAARNISGPVAFSGAAWYRPDYRGRSLSAILPRISRAYAYAIWDTECTVTFIAQALVNKGLAGRCGYTNVDWAVQLNNFPIGDYYGALVWMATNQMLDDLSEFMAARRAAQVNRRVHERSA